MTNIHYEGASMRGKFRDGRRVARRIVFLLMALMIVMVMMVTAILPATAAGSVHVLPALTIDSSAAEVTSQLQFTSCGNILGFNPDGVFIASASHMVKTDFEGANKVVPQAGGAGQPTSGGATSLLGKVTYTNLWDGVTLVYEASPGSVFKSTYYIDGTGTDKAVQNICLLYNRPVMLDAQGDLVVAFDTGTFIEKSPVAWQEIDGERRPVDAGYVLKSGNEIGFILGNYEAGIPVVIDPDTTWNTFIGGMSEDNIYGVAVDSSGNVYITGYSTATWGSPKISYSGGASDILVVKLDSSGNLVWSAFLGGTGADIGNGIAVDASGNIYVTGYSTAAWGSPIQGFSGNYDAFIAKLSGGGALTWSTFAGGSGYDYGEAVAADTSGNIYVAGYSTAVWGAPVRGYSSGNDAFAAKFDSSGTLTWSTFLGGAGDDKSYSIAEDTGGNVYVAGYSTAAWGAPVRGYSSGSDAFAAKLDSSGALTWNTFLGGPGTEVAYGVAVDGSGNIYAAGSSTAVWGAPVRGYSSGSDAFAAKLTSSGTLTWNTFLGGSGTEAAYGVAVDSSGTVYAAGCGTSAWGAPVRGYSSGSDAFAAKLTSSGALTWSTFLGGAGNDYGFGVAVDTGGNVYAAGCSPATWGAPVLAYISGVDAFAARLDSSGNLVPVPEISVEGNSTAITSGDMTPSSSDNTDFGSAAVSGGSIDKIFTIKNTGSGVLTLSGTPKVSLSGTNAADFSVTVQPAPSVAATSGSTTFTIHFDPSVRGIRTATVSIANNDSDENPYTFAVQGKGTIVLTVSGLSALGKVYDGSATAAITGTGALVGVVSPDVVTMTGTAMGIFSDAAAGAGKGVVISGLSLGGADAGNYTLTQAHTVTDITQRAINITSDSQIKENKASDPNLGYSVTYGSLVGDDGITGTLTRESGEIPGIYQISQGSLTAGDNYKITFISSLLTITQLLPDTTTTHGVVTQKLGFMVLTTTKFISNGWLNICAAILAVILGFFFFYIRRRKKTDEQYVE